MHTELITKLKSVGVIEQGDFILRSGEHSDFYCDLKKSFGHPFVLHDIAVALKSLIPNGTTCLAAAGYGGIPLATALSLESTLPLCLVRDVVKEHGTKSLFDGYIPTSSDRVAIVDDVFTTGGSAHDIITKLSQLGCSVNSVLVAVRRGSLSPDLPVKALFTDAELFPS
ncbi:MAG: Orotate phosphoribosyltransferase [Parcubacteria group bacterium GW2011_GWA2_47_7]|nr:MAG: Orotate phosphoribosyltransferase [Parcubacteria group bacterium GW2011_GWA2_47_7]